MKLLKAGRARADLVAKKDTNYANEQQQRTLNTESSKHTNRV